MASLVQQAVDDLTFLVEDLWGFSDLQAIHRTDLEAFAAHFGVVNEVQEAVDNAFHRCQKTFFLQLVVKGADADARPSHMRADSIERDVLLREVFAIRADETYGATE